MKMKKRRGTPASWKPRRSDDVAVLRLVGARRLRVQLRPGLRFRTASKSCVELFRRERLVDHLAGAEALVEWRRCERAVLPSRRQER